MVRLSPLSVTVILIVPIGLFGCAWLFYHWLQQPGPLTDEQTVVLKAGSSVEAIADHLATAGAIDHPNLFRLAVRLRPGDNFLKAGEYKLRPGSTANSIIDDLIAGKTVVHKITIPEGFTLAQVFDAVSSAQALSGVIDVEVEEGFLLPDTYHYSLNNDRTKLVQHMEELMRETLAQLWMERDDGLPYQNPRDAVILASIVEKETAVAGERRRIAGVFINRLKLGMPLQSDPTVLYGISMGKGPIGRPLQRKELRDRSNPYNTYRHHGLPPGAISNPGKASLIAALSPLDTEELYFVANGAGGHNFAKTLKQHNKNVADWKNSNKQKQDCGAC